LAFALLACERKPDEPTVVEPKGPTAEKPPPIDRLAPGELAQGSEEVFGLPIPRQMKLEHRFPKEAYVVGRVTPEAVANYVRTRVTVSHVELGAARTVFPRALIHGAPPDRTFRIEVVPAGLETKLVIRDITKAPAPKGLREADRWRRAGLKPNGEPLDLSELE
jgi:hypothetical protein